MYWILHFYLLFYCPVSRWHEVFLQVSQTGLSNSHCATQDGNDSSSTQQRWVSLLFALATLLNEKQRGTRGLGRRVSLLSVLASRIHIWFSVKGKGLILGHKALQAPLQLGVSPSYLLSGAAAYRLQSSPYTTGEWIDPTCPAVSKEERRKKIAMGVGMSRQRKKVNVGMGSRKAEKNPYTFLFKNVWIQLSHCFACYIMGFFPFLQSWDTALAKTAKAWAKK